MRWTAGECRSAYREGRQVKINGQLIKKEKAPERRLISGALWMRSVTFAPFPKWTTKSSRSFSALLLPLAAGGRLVFSCVVDFSYPK